MLEYSELHVVFVCVHDSVKSQFSFYRGAKIFSTFIGFLKSKSSDDGTEQTLLIELISFNNYLKENVSLLSCFQHDPAFELYVCVNCVLLSLYEPYFATV